MGANTSTTSQLVFSSGEISRTMTRTLVIRAMIISAAAMMIVGSVYGPTMMESPIASWMIISSSHTSAMLTNNCSNIASTVSAVLPDRAFSSFMLPLRRCIIINIPPSYISVNPISLRGA